jgi:5'-3' exonuclease
MAAPERLPEPGDARAFYVVDLHHFVWRHVAAVGMRGAESFVQWFSRLMEQRRPAYLVCADDAPGGSFRAEILREAGYVGDDAYKGNRRKLRDEDLAVLADQREEIRTFVEDCGVPVVSAPGFEADDVVATLVRAASEAPRLSASVVVSSDHDLLQLVGERPGGGTCVMWDGAFDVRGPEGCKRALGVAPERVADFFAVRGGKNNVPGVPKLGGVRAAALLQAGGLDDLLTGLARCTCVEDVAEMFPSGVKAAWGLYLREGADVARLGLRLTRLRDDVPLDLPRVFSLARRA